MDRLPPIKHESLKLVVNGIRVIQPILLKHAVSKMPYTCYEAGHTWDESCVNSAIILFIGSFKRCLRVYAPLYFLSAIIRGRPLKYYMSKLPREIIQSSVFLAANCFYFIGFFCLSRKFFGNINYWGTLLFNIPACFLSILLERKQRRGLLALYLTNLATETAFNMLVYRKKVSVIPNGEVLLFAIASAFYSLLYKTQHLDGSLSNLIKNLIGTDTITPDVISDHHYLRLTRQSRIIKYFNAITVKLHRLTDNSNNPILKKLKSFERKLESLLDSLNKSFHRHDKCVHRYNCFTYAINGFVQRFVVGFLLQAAFKCIGSLTSIIKRPQLLFKILKNPVNRELGLFLGSYVFIFRLVSCVLRWLTNQNDKWHSMIAGFFSGWSMIFYKSSTIAMYLNFKLIEIFWFIGVNDKKLPLIKSFDIILYTLSTAFVLWVCLFEAHNIRPAYWRFLVNISDNKLTLVNRSAFDAFGTDASSIDRNIVYKKI